MAEGRSGAGGLLWRLLGGAAQQMGHPFPPVHSKEEIRSEFGKELRFLSRRHTFGCCTNLDEEADVVF